MTGHVRKRCLTILLFCPLFFVPTKYALAEVSSSDEGWPRTHQTESGELVVYQPQIQSWEEHAILTASMALQVIPKGKESGTYGVLGIRARTETNYQTRTVLITDMEIEDLRFPGADEATKGKSEGMVKAFLEGETAVPISLDRLIAAMEISNLDHRIVEVNLDPPPIFHSSEPAILVTFLGEPQFEAVEATGLLFAANTNWDLLLDSASGNYFLLDGESWLTTSDLQAGPWTAAGELPKEFQNLPDDDNWSAVKAAIPGVPFETVPKVFTSNEPTELIVVDGKPSYSPIPGVALLEVTNTDRDLFLNPPEKTHYFLTAGRWFRSETLEGPWSAATEDLPDDFSKIPLEYSKGDVLASVPGTEEAEAAVLLASIPQKAHVDRKSATLEVAYDGEPVFEEIESTAVSYAVNSPNDVFLVNKQYYCCQQGVWFCSSTERGPWEVCDSVPDEIYSIPSNHPMHNVTYVYVYESTPDTVVTGYTSGYTGAYVSGAGIVAFGLGYWLAHEYAEDHWGHYHVCPHYYGYGCGARYDYYHGGFYRGVGYYGPYGGAGRHAVYNPATGAYGRSAYRYGPNGGAYARQAYNPYTDRYAARAGASTPYGSWGRSVVADGNDWAAGGHRSNWKGTVAGGRTSEGGAVVAGKNRVTGESGMIGKNRHGDAYVGKDGNLYKREESGGWQKFNDGSWDDLQKPTTRNRDRSEAARIQPTDRKTRENVQARDRVQTQPQLGDRRQPQTVRPGTQPRSYDRQAQAYQQYRQQEQARNLSQSNRANMNRANMNRAPSQRPNYYGQQNRSSQVTGNQLNQQYRARQTGQNRTQNYRSSQSRGGVNRGSSSASGRSRGGSRGGGRGGGGRGGGRR